MLRLLRAIRALNAVRYVTYFTLPRSGCIITYRGSFPLRSGIAYILGFLSLPLAIEAGDILVVGRVLDENHAPVAAAQVRFLPIGTSGGSGFAVSTGPGGSFKTRLPAPGRWQVSVRHEGF